MDFAPHQQIQVRNNCQITGEYLTKGTRGTIMTISESPAWPVIYVKFGEVVLPMREHEISPVEEPQS